MGHQAFDRIAESTTTTGNGAISLLGASQNFRSFDSKLSIGDTCEYLIEDYTNSVWERGIGTYSSLNTLTRTTIIASSNANAVVTLVAGTKFVSLVDSCEVASPLAEYIGNAAVLSPTIGSRVFSRKRGGRGMASQTSNAASVEYAFQPFLGRNKASLYSAIGNGTGVSLVGTVDNVTGTATARNVATTNMFTSIRRKGYVSLATAGASAGWRHGLAQNFRGSAQGLGGFHFIARCGVSHAAAVANARGFIGMSATVAAIGNVEPNTLNNSVGFGWNAGETTLKVLSRNGTTTTTVDLGVNFPTTNLSTNLWELEMYVGAFPDLDIKWTAKNHANGAFVEGTITNANCPVQNTLMGMQIWINNGVTALAAGIDIDSVYWESDL
jgi:hypothetical protein